jgi:two-component sensor histidine kinase
MRDGALTLTWRERGGPPVKAPSRRGFGSRLLEQSVAHDLGGPCRLDYAADGLTWEAKVAL